jgi:DUF971 family protein
MQPIKINLNKETNELQITWENSVVHNFPLNFLRDESPDAQNKGEHILWKTIPAPPKGPDRIGKYEIAKIDLIGNYAIQITWKDGYDYGIFSFELLQKWGKLLEVSSNPE